jgi:hypothetical protein
MNLALDRRLPWSIVVEALEAQPVDEVYLAFPAKQRMSAPPASGESWSRSNVTVFYLQVPDPACLAEPPFALYAPSIDEQRANVDTVLTAYQSEACNCRPNPAAMKEGFWYLFHGGDMATATRRVRLAKPGDPNAASFSAPGETTFEGALPKLLKLAASGRPIAVAVAAVEPDP